MKLIVLEEVADRFGEHFGTWHNCVKCEIGEIAHEHVFARGTLPCDVLFIGEGPGKTEDMVGTPFIGRAGKLLDKWIEHAVCHRNVEIGNDDLDEFRYAITNIVLCRGCDYAGGPNRPPTATEVANCFPRLLEFVQHVAKPKVIVTLGRPAATYSSRLPAEIKRLELIHPSAILRNMGEGSPEEVREKARLAEFLLKELV